MPEQEERSIIRPTVEVEEAPETQGDHIELAPRPHVVVLTELEDPPRLVIDLEH